mmetsp:Transcript_3763/g.9496  ORF Transcript_3763/g.9496 Transcript_3763/m.9496 type:complete len:90 (+) Transcript_3763:718-987(+)
MVGTACFWTTTTTTTLPSRRWSRIPAVQFGLWYCWWKIKKPVVRREGNVWLSLVVRAGCCLGGVTPQVRIGGKQKGHDENGEGFRVLCT